MVLSFVETHLKSNNNARSNLPYCGQTHLLVFATCRDVNFRFNVPTDSVVRDVDTGQQLLNRTLLCTVNCALEFFLNPKNTLIFSSLNADSKPFLDKIQRQKFEIFNNRAKVSGVVDKLSIARSSPP